MRVFARHIVHVHALSCLLVVGGALVGWEARAQDGDRTVLKLGLELDTNARREVGEGAQRDQLLRVFFKTQQAHVLDGVGRFDAKLMLGGKVFRDTPDEDVLISALNLGWLRPVFEHEGGGLALYGRLDGADRSESASRRDYTRGGVSGGLRYQLGPVAASAGGGYRFFVFKPDAASNNDGASLEASLGAGWEAWSLGVQYMRLARGFEVERFVEAVTEQGQIAILADAQVLRRDTLHTLRASLGWRGWAQARLGYTLQVNRSNSYGPGLTRHIGDAWCTLALPGELALALRASVQRTGYEDTVRIDQTLQIDDENRNLVTATLRWSLADPLGVELRYALYTQAFSDEAEFTRQLFFLGVSLELDPAESDLFED